jgi:hypothetical protein
MASVKFTVNIDSSTVGPDKIKFLLTKNISVTEPMVNTSKYGLTSVATVLVAAITPRLMVFAKNTHATETITIEDGSANALAVLKSGEFAVFPVKTNVGVSAKTDSGAAVVEFGYWAIND